MTAPRQSPCKSVLQVVLSLDPGGTERLVIEIVKRLKSRYLITICCLDSNGSWADELAREGIEVVALHRKAGFRPRLAVQIARIARSRGASVIHCHHYSPFVYSQIASLLARRVSVIYTEHGRQSDQPTSLKRRVASTLFARLPCLMYAVCEDLRRDMIRGGFPAGRLGVVYNGIDIGSPAQAAARAQLRRIAGIPEDAFVVGAVARFDPVKDIPTLVDAFAIFKRHVPDARLVLVGDGPARVEVERTILECGLAESSHLLGQRRNARELIGMADVYVNSSATEGVSLTILEAMAAALPVIATRVGGTPEIVEDGVTGLLVPPRDPARLADALARIYCDRLLARLLAENGRSLVATRFRIERMVDEYASAYESVHHLAVGPRWRWRGGRPSEPCNEVVR